MNYHPDMKNFDMDKVVPLFNEIRITKAEAEDTIYGEYRGVKFCYSSQLDEDHLAMHGTSAVQEFQRSIDDLFMNNTTEKVLVKKVSKFTYEPDGVHVSFEIVRNK